MEIHQVIEKIERYIEEQKSQVESFKPEEWRVLPSSDINDHIKVWLNLGPDKEHQDLEWQRKRLVEGLREAIPELSEFGLEVRLESF